MPLHSTHIRFALDIKNDYQVQDIKKYISGAIYPDSRFFTKINRELTHGDEVLEPEFAIDDFRSGWQTHRICDRQFVKFNKIIPLSSIKKLRFGDEEWIFLTALKIVQDINDTKKFPIQKYIKYLEYARNPNGENLDKIKKYNQIVINLYKNKKVPTPGDYYQMWIALEIDNELGLKIKNKAIEIMNNNSLVKKIEKIYTNMIKNYRSIFK